MKRFFCLLFATFLIIVFPSYNNKPAYNLFNKQGKKISYSKMLDEIQRADVILFGELHNNPVSHWVEISLLKDLYKFKRENLIAGAEMFETDKQDLLNLYLRKEIDERELIAKGNMWPNFRTDYAPLISFASEKNIPFIASNAPKELSKIVGRNGVNSLDTLDEEKKKYIAKLPVMIDLSLQGYKKILSEDMHGHKMNMQFIAEAQALKDATMAQSIYTNRKPGQVFLHFNGDYHSANFEGIYWYLKKMDGDLKVITISTVEQESVEKLQSEFKDRADYILAVPDDMTKTY